MKHAWIGSPLGAKMSAEDFYRRFGAEYLAKGAIPYCRGCGVVLQPSGMNSPDAAKRFDHPDRRGADPAEDCVHARRDDPRFRGLEPTEYDERQGSRLRQEFFHAHIDLAYAFCLRRCGYGNLPVGKFHELIRRADRRRIWSYVGMEPWLVPPVLLTLADFSGRSGAGRSFGFRFAFVTPRGSGRAAVLEQPARCKLLKVFANGAVFSGADNPLELTRTAVTTAAGDRAWIGPELMALLRRLA